VHFDLYSFAKVNVFKSTVFHYCYMFRYPGAILREFKIKTCCYVTEHYIRISQQIRLSEAAKRHKVCQNSEFYYMSLFQ